jgi:nucleotide-binding universal stress UspA family protein
VKAAPGSAAAGLPRGLARPLACNLLKGQLMKIVYATDFSAPSAPARRLAAGLARRLGDSIVVVHVLETPSVFSPELIAAEPAVLEGMKTSAAQQIKAIGDGIRADGVAAEERVLVGSPHDAVSRLADELDARLVVLGTHGRSALGRLFLGSMAERLVRSCNRPVIVVPPEARYGPLDAPMKQQILKLTVALDRGPAGEAAVALAGALRASAACEVTFVHLYDSEREHTRLGLEHPHAGVDPDPDVTAVLTRDLRPLIKDLHGEGPTSLQIRASRSRGGEALAWAAIAGDADLLVVGAAAHRGGLRERSAAVEVIRGSTVPVLVAPATTREASARLRTREPLGAVLAATDLSEPGNAAVADAYRLLRGWGGVVELCHVEAPHGDPPSPERWADIQKRLWSLVPPEAEADGIVTRVSVLEGNSPADAIVHASERLGAELIVVGSHGRTGLSRAVLGSVAESVVRRSTKPVLIVRQAR